MSTAWSGASAKAPVSVVIPCFQAHATLPRALASVAQQTTRALEVIVVDDASGVETAAVLRELQRQYGQDWLRLVSLERNRGPASARNAGWAAARGDYIAFLDSDDSWHPRKIEIQYAWMAAHPAIRVSGHDWARLSHGQAPGDVPAMPTVRFPSPHSYLFKNPYITPAVMVRRDLPYRFHEERRYMEDLLLWQTMALSGEQIAFIQAPLAFVHKALYGAGGLSADMVAMERGALANYWVLRAMHLISLPAALALSAYSLMKFVRRLVIVALRRSGS